MWCYAEVLQAVQNDQIDRVRKGQWLPAWNIGDDRVDFWIKRLDARCLIDAPARGLPVMEDAGTTVLDVLRDSRDLEYLDWTPA